MKILDRYLVTHILQAAGVVGAVVTALALVTSFIGEAGELGQGDYGLAAMLEFIVLHLPDDVRQVYPVAVLLGSLLALGGLAANRELVVIRSAGVSAARLAVAVLLAGAVLAAVSILLNEFLGPRGVQAADALRDRAQHGNRAQTLGDGLWLRNGPDYIRIGGTLPGQVVVDVEVYHVNDDGQLGEIVEAARARYAQGAWQMQDVTVTHLSTAGVQVTHSQRRRWALGLEPSVLKLSVVKPDELSSPGLVRYIRYLQSNHVDAQSYRLALWRNLVAPLTVIVLALFALPFAFGSLRSAGAGQRLLVGGLVGLVFYMVNEIVAASGVVYGLPAWLAASAPTLALAVLTAWWLRRL